MPVVNWCYAAKQPVTFSEEIERQIRLAHQYRNKLCEIEIAHRERIYQMWRDLAPDYLKAESELNDIKASIESILSGIKLRGQKNRKKEKATAEEKEQLATLRAQRKEAYEHFKEVKAAVKKRGEIQRGFEALDKQRHQLQIEARLGVRMESLFWGSYLTVEDACKTFSKGAPPQFKRFDREGKCAVQVQHGISVEDVINGKDSRIRIEILDEPSPKKNMLMALIRIGSVGKRKEPLFAKVPIILHRPLPPGGRVKWVYLERWFVGSHAAWQIRFTVAIPPRIRIASEKAVALHLGWRQLNTGSIRSAVWLGSDGQEGEIIIPNTEVKFRAYADRLQSIREINFNTAILKLKGWMEVNEAILPDWVKEDTHTISKWKAIRRLVAFVFKLKKNRFEGDQEIVDCLEAWRKQDRHLWDWQANQRRKASARRNLAYRRIVKELSQRYQRVIVTDTDWRELKKKQDADKSDSQTPQMRFNSSLAAVGILSDYAIEKFGEDCTIVVSAKDITRKCHRCGTINESIEDRRHRCVHCDFEWDIDRNGVRNQMTLGMEGFEDLPLFDDLMTARLTAKEEFSKRQAQFRSKKKKKEDDDPPTDEDEAAA